MTHCRKCLGDSATLCRKCPTDSATLCRKCRTDSATLCRKCTSGSAVCNKCLGDSATFYRKCTSDSVIFYNKCFGSSATLCRKCTSDSATFYRKCTSDSVIFYNKCFALQLPGNNRWALKESYQIKLKNSVIRKTPLQTGVGEKRRKKRMFTMENDIQDRLQAMRLHLPDPPVDSDDEDESGASTGSIPMDPDHVELVKNAMAAVKLPSISIPIWAQQISDADWDHLVHQTIQCRTSGSTSSKK
ncbi:male-enhanced antigen 1 [Pelobates cultripes]|uniref:Male-enhanced antigen 1 n=1 Tax=Pelobates cultripes TaxID=61616 RepID=A0AAD1VVX9_PELCU|nr:male-enhanced antigen 1 [Pelobates cultripes]